MDKYLRSVYQFLLAQPGYGFNTRMYDPKGHDKADFVRACKYLCKRGYAKETKVGYALTHEGIHKRELELRAFWYAFFTKFIAGLAVGAGGTIIAQAVLQVLFRL